MKIVRNNKGILLVIIFQTVFFSLKTPSNPISRPLTATFVVE